MSTDEDFVKFERELDEVDDEPRLIATHYCGAEEAAEMVRAAQVLGLGVRLQNRWRSEGADEDGMETQAEEWVLDIFENPPAAVDED